LSTRKTGQPLALFESPVFDAQTLQLPPGWVLLLYTDGALDMQDPAGAQFGEERLLPAAAEARRAGGSAQQMCESVWQSLEAWRGPATQADDVALVVIQADGGAQR
jgi:sigma-B regulation protein RsbU (phosphoserine phosphatase)